MDINTITMSGRMTKDAEYIGDSGKLISFSIALNRSVKNKAGEWENKPVFIDCKAFRALDYIHKNGKKGTKVSINGEIDMDTWEKDGQKRSRITVIVNNIDFPNAFSQEGSSDSNKEEVEEKPEAKEKPTTKAKTNTKSSPTGEDDLPF